MKVLGLLALAGALRHAQHEPKHPVLRKQPVQLLSRATGAKVQQPSIEVAQDQGAIGNTIPTVEHDRAPPAADAPATTATPSVAMPEAAVPAAPELQPGVLPKPVGDVVEDAGVEKEVVHVMEEPAAEAIEELAEGGESAKHVLIFVAICLGLMIVRFGVYYYACWGRKRTEGMPPLHPAAPLILRPSQDRSFGGLDLFVCFSGKCWNTCCETVCCADMLWVELVSERLKWTSMWAACGLTTLFCLCKDLGALCFVCTRFFTRKKIREEAEKRSTGYCSRDCCTDCCVHLCCHEFALYQELEFVECQK